MPEDDINKFKSDIVELREVIREAATSVRNHAAQIREIGVEVSEMAKTARKFDPGPGAIEKADYNNLLAELENLRNLAISLKDENET